MKEELYQPGRNLPHNNLGHVLTRQRGWTDWSSSPGNMSLSCIISGSPGRKMSTVPRTKLPLPYLGEEERQREEEWRSVMDRGGDGLMEGMKEWMDGWSGWMDGGMDG